ncbi:unnamed protein product [Litomosoides sigmodontis]|uniref:Uncharacterized protein n=1 Tax=Litomosoides sigmodontis TaxID=42156 RepID=A0A3P7K834_LITSI|nr:unnamed protein product [Litomosoides sigmodontis]
MLLFCCCRLYYCALALSFIDTTIVGILLYRTVDLSYRYRFKSNNNWIDFAVLAVLSAFLLCQVLSLIALAISIHWNNSRYVLPRLTLLSGQLAITTFICIILIFYFMGFTEKFNDIVIGSYEYWANDKMNEDDRKRAVQEMLAYAIGSFVTVFMYTVYELIEFCVTRMYQKTLDTPPEFIPVRSQEPTRLAGPKLSIEQPHILAPPPPYRSHYH